MMANRNTDRKNGNNNQRTDRDTKNPGSNLLNHHEDIVHTSQNNGPDTIFTNGNTGKMNANRSTGSNTSTDRTVYPSQYVEPDDMVGSTDSNTMNTNRGTGSEQTIESITVTTNSGTGSNLTDTDRSADRTLFTSEITGAKTGAYADYNNQYADTYATQALHQEASAQNQNRNLLLRGILLGGLIGGALTLLDSRTRSKVVDTAVNVKDTSVGVVSQVAENPKDTMGEMMDRFKAASTTLQEAIGEAQNIYDMMKPQLTAFASGAGTTSANVMNAAALVNVAMEAKDRVVEVKDKAMEAVSHVAEAGKTLSPSSTTTTSDMSTTSGTSTTSSTSTKENGPSGTTH
ncbi:hypothetical protein [Peribacillus sp. SCS-155]|uniref:hypothetical protein n=1 Tax=Peribacillus sedimenti TaxID=3115297 RepID=UPI003905BB03